MAASRGASGSEPQPITALTEASETWQTSRKVRLAMVPTCGYGVARSADEMAAMSRGADAADLCWPHGAASSILAFWPVAARSRTCGGIGRGARSLAR